ncbi:MAG: DUF2179 domain-containing protein [Bacillaceae bacterium]|nr:DUF2179 domain-containing protein [Bacillaceae bacterium]
MGLVLIIIVINVVYVSLFTLRMILVLKNNKVLASLLSMVEVFIYLMGLSIVLDNLDKPLNILAYCIGWGTGVYLGSRIEEMLALGYVTVQIVLDSAEVNVAQALREKGYGVTSWLADGKDGKRLVMQVLAKRSNEKKLMKTIESLSPKAFVISYEPKTFKGGFWVKKIFN